MTTPSNYLVSLLVCLLPLTVAAQESGDRVDSKRCITTRTLKSTVVVDDANILFFMVGSSVYHNVLPKACDGLMRYKTFSYERFAGRICESDFINVLRDSGVGSARRCRLGSFRPIDSKDIPDLIYSLHRPPEAETLPPASVEDIGETSDPEE